jgi:hypothetical protein
MTVRGNDCGAEGSRCMIGNESRFPNLVRFDKSETEILVVRVQSWKSVVSCAYVLVLSSLLVQAIQHHSCWTDRRSGYLVRYITLY